ncbi:putative N-acylneuraminate-9-phosphatase [Scophthalmus maximus]|uniref:Putative N-acylneuraminate-9-phosphatase n=2 Tax=Scophthalmus maximus TaxID=52904 RepID=A0A2U9CDU2_SCOMX|nr:putative N-acylneuraminate-9-phosphatase [Scophthalmus maximus]
MHFSPSRASAVERPVYFQLVCPSTMAGQTVKAVLFDLDNTLIETSRAGGAAMRKTSELLKTTLGLDDNTTGVICDKFKQKLFHEQFDPAAGRSIDDVRVGHWEESIQETVSGSRTPSLAAQCYSMWKNSRLEVLSLSPQIRDLLRQLRSRYKLLLLTNGEAQTQREKVEAVGCEEFFDAIVIGGEHAEQKPFASIFTLCFNTLGVEAQDCVMVGDSLDTDIQGGFDARVRATVWISSAGGAVADGSVIPDYTIPTVLDLPHILAQLK